MGWLHGADYNSHPRMAAHGHGTGTAAQSTEGPAARSLVRLLATQTTTPRVPHEQSPHVPGKDGTKPSKTLLSQAVAHAVLEGPLSPALRLGPIQMDGESTGRVRMARGQHK
eukprot:CAMPEP_0181192540 /NCGR_PEP_ID=MMETSP1096-20121128/13337_1 /TAXON_ID=156174 ORGANISM="Chrysochromulina ericina, Strain CCMP281" /NCGR_SAMPLE_ID=MMETSP1096 /ASSEMBLY_ACC=CAM_ASM_000453 /LENGTH=111 /DNA_ID=CAMNT_0023281941 /DNA_START=302 /DNA_END=637 /DNA_ORIENTATION=+